MTAPALDTTRVDVPQRDLRALAPLFAMVLAEGLNRAWAAGLDPVVYEATRSDARQRWLYAQGRTRPGEIVTDAPSALYGWHFYGLAVDVVSRAHQWDDPTFFGRVAPYLKAAGLAWGGDWPHPDRPHFQWRTLRASPSDRARALYAEGGLPAVWHVVGAA